MQWWALFIVFHISGCADRNAKSVWRAIHTVVDQSAYTKEAGQRAILTCASLSRDEFIELAVPILDDELSDKGNFYEFVKTDMKHAQYIALSDSETDKFHKALASSFYDRILTIANELNGGKKPAANNPPKQMNKQEPNLQT
jgi:hypothetical protein